MPSNKSAAAAFAVVIAVASWVLVGSGQAPQPSALPLEPTKERGSSITPAYEGWFPNEDGTFTMLVGYFNRNAREALDIPVGPNNRIEPGGPDMGQPTYFETRRQWGVFTIQSAEGFRNKEADVDADGQRGNQRRPLHAEQRATKSSPIKSRAWATRRRR